MSQSKEPVAAAARCRARQSIALGGVLLLGLGVLASGCALPRLTPRSAYPGTVAGGSPAGCPYVFHHTQWQPLCPADCGTVVEPCLPNAPSDDTKRLGDVPLTDTPPKYVAPPVRSPSPLSVERIPAGSPIEPERSWPSGRIAPPATAPITAPTTAPTTVPTTGPTLPAEAPAISPPMTKPSTTPKPSATPKSSKGLLPLNPELPTEPETSPQATPKKPFKGILDGGAKLRSPGTVRYQAQSAPEHQGLLGSGASLLPEQTRRLGRSKYSIRMASGDVSTGQSTVAGTIVDAGHRAPRRIPAKASSETRLAGYEATSSSPPSQGGVLPRVATQRKACVMAPAGEVLESGAALQPERTGKLSRLFAPHEMGSPFDLDGP